MPSKPWENVPGSNRIVVSFAESSRKFASRHECPKCVNCMPILWRSGDYPGGTSDVRLLLALAVATCGLVIAPNTPADAVPGVCPPICDSIPDSASIAPTAVPLDPVYHWPGLAGLAVRSPVPRFTFEEMCASPPIIGDARDYSVAWQATVLNPPGQWQLRVQIMHWRGDTAHFGPTATATLELA